MVAPVEVGEGGVGLLVRNGLLKEHQTRDRKAVGESPNLARTTAQAPRFRGPGS